MGLVETVCAITEGGCFIPVARYSLGVVSSILFYLLAITSFLLERKYCKQLALIAAIIGTYSYILFHNIQIMIAAGYRDNDYYNADFIMTILFTALFVPLFISLIIGLTTFILKVLLRRDWKIVIITKRLFLLIQFLSTIRFLLVSIW